MRSIWTNEKCKEGSETNLEKENAKRISRSIYKDLKPANPNKDILKMYASKESCDEKSGNWPADIFGFNLVYGHIFKLGK